MNTKYTGRERWILASLALAFFIAASNVMIMSSLIKFMQRELGFSKLWYGVLMASTPVAAFVVNLLVGPYLEKYGKSRSMQYGALGTLVVFTATALAPNFPLLLGLRVLVSFFSPILSAAVLPLAMEIFAPEKRSQVTGQIMSGAYMAQVLSIPLGILAGGYISWRWAFGFFALLSGMLFFLSRAYLPRKNEERGTHSITWKTHRGIWKNIAENKTLLRALGVFIALIFGIGVFSGLYTVWLFESFRGTEYITLKIAGLFLLGGAGASFGSFYSARLTFGVKNLLNYLAILSFISIPLVLLISPMRDYLVLQYLLYLAVMVLGGVRNPLFQSYILGELCLQRLRGSLMGVMNALFAAGIGLGYLLSSFLHLNDSSFALNALVAALIHLCCGLYLKFGLQDKGVPKPRLDFEEN